MTGTGLRSDWLREKGLFLLLFSLLIMARCLHLEPLLDGPHIWRQADTAHYIYDFYHNGTDFFYPEVCWMGGFGKTILEFPLPEAIIADIYSFTGESHIVARLFFLLCFLIASAYLYRIIRLISGERIAQTATLIYLIMPMGLFYSRAVHVDFFAIAAVHGMVFHFLAGIRDQNFLHLGVSVLLASVAFLVKIPYAFYLVLPLAGYYYRKRGFQRLIPLLLAYSLPLVLFLFWHSHRQQVNGSVPDWDFIPHYRKFIDMWGWYFGDSWQRSEWRNYTLIMNRVADEILTLPGIILALTGLVFRKVASARYFWGLWLVGTILYGLIFFNLNRIHNYYQLPFMAPFAVWIAFGIESIADIFGQIRHSFAGILRYGFLAVMAFSGFRYAETHYYKENTLYPEAGWYISQETDPHDLVIATHGGLDPRAPHLLYGARRKGWSIPINDLEGELVARLQEEGARWSAVIAGPGAPEGKLKFLGAPFKSFDLSGTGEKLFLFDLRPESYESSPQR